MNKPGLIAAITFLSVIHPCDAKADAPCREVEGGVLCSTEGFKALTDGLIDLQAETEKAALKVVSAEKAQKEAEEALAACMVPAPPPAPPNVRVKPLVSFGLGVIGAGLMTAASVSDGEASLRAGLGLGGLLSLVGGILLLERP